MAESAVPVDEATRRLWAEFAHHIRVAQWVLDQVPRPEEGSPFQVADHAYPRELVSQWSRETLRSATDHLGLWADTFVPRGTGDERPLELRGLSMGLRPGARRAQGSAQSAWLTGAATPHESIARLIRMVRHDLGEQRVAWAEMGRPTQSIDKRLMYHERSAQSLLEHGPADKRLPAMVDLLRAAATHFGSDPDTLTANWRLCSAAAHGKSWATVELQEILAGAVEWTPGQFQVRTHLDPRRMNEIMSDTTSLVSATTLRYLTRTYTGDIATLMRRGALEVAKATPQTDDGALIEETARRWKMEP